MLAIGGLKSIAAGGGSASFSGTVTGLRFIATATSGISISIASNASAITMADDANRISWAGGVFIDATATGLRCNSGFRSDAASGSNGILFSTAGTRLKFSTAGTTDYLSSNGTTTISAAGEFAAAEFQSLVLRGAAGATNYINLHSSAGISINSGDSGKVTIDSGTLAITALAGTAGSGTGITVNSTAFVRKVLHKITVAHTAVQTAGLTRDITLWTLPAKTRVERVIADVTQTFQGGAITDVDVTVGRTAGGNQYLLTFDVDTAIGTYGDVVAEMGAGVVSATLADIQWGSTTDVQCRFTSVGANLSALTQGSMTVYIECSVYP